VRARETDGRGGLTRMSGRAHASMVHFFFEKLVIHADDRSGTKEFGVEDGISRQGVRVFRELRLRVVAWAVVACLWRECLCCC